MEKKKIIFSIIGIVVALGIILFFWMNRKIDSNNIGNQKKIEDLKYEVGATGDSNIYELQTSNSSKEEILTVKASVKYKVAFAGMIKKALPTMEEVEKVLQDNHPQENGIWIEKNSREKIVEVLNNKEIFNSKYVVNENGYIVLEEENKANANDKKLQKAVNSEKQYIISISSICYIVDEITGEILDYSFENMDKYQTYEYFEDGNKDILFITENKENQLSEKEIVDSVLEWLNS